MSSVKRRFGLLGAAVIALIAAMLPAVPAADAAAAPWTWKRVTQNASIPANSASTIRPLCGAGYTAMTGGLSQPLLSTVRVQAQYRRDDVSGSGWQVIARNFENNAQSVTVVSECVETTDLPGMSYNVNDIGQSGGFAEGTVSCANAGEVVVSGGAEWFGSATNRELLASAPASTTSWYANAYNPETADLRIEVRCAQAADVPGYQQVDAVRTSAGGWYTDTATCPVGKRIVTGGALPTNYGSSPNLTTWTSTIERISGDANHVTRAMCINAGTPTVQITFASPGAPGSTVGTGNAGFSFAGTDPAGYPNNFTCSIDGSARASCNTGASYTDLASGAHEFEVWNEAADGRDSDSAAYEWTVDRTGPSVTKPKLPKVTLTPTKVARWSATDELSNVTRYVAQYKLFRADGSATLWVTPTGWENLTEPKVRTPEIAQGDTLCVTVRAFDQFNNPSTYSNATCTTRPFDDAELDTTSNGWTRASGTQFYLDTITRTQGLDRTLARTDMNLNRVGVVATKCSGCGAVVVRVGGTKIGRISLNANSTMNRQVVLLPAFGDTTGTVTIRSVTTGRSISIDGLVAIRGSTAPPF